jgi:hypothetical protein
MLYHRSLVCHDFYQPYDSTQIRVGYFQHHEAEISGGKMKTTFCWHISVHELVENAPVADPGFSKRGRGRAHMWNIPNMLPSWMQSLIKILFTIFDEFVAKLRKNPNHVTRYFKEMHIINFCCRQLKWFCAQCL